MRSKGKGLADPLKDSCLRTPGTAPLDRGLSCCIVKDCRIRLVNDVASS
jgi:hypothetical protein